MGISRTPLKGGSTGTPGLLTDGLVDEMLGCYLDWRHDAAAAAEACRLWSAVSGGDEALRFAAYMAALDQEESSAFRYALVSREVESALRHERSMSPGRLAS
jgi:hypothetical protein